MELPALTTEMMVEVDRLMVEDYGISLIQMMENAGGNLARLALRLMGGPAESNRIVVLCGGGNNGGGGMVAARHLHNHGLDVRIALAANPDQLKEIPALQWGIINKMGIEKANEEDFLHADLIIDALIGYGIKGYPQGLAANWINMANASGVPILSLDTPSGLDTTSGLPGEPCIRASATMTLALPKVGLLSEAARPVVGALYLADISVPPELYKHIGLDVSPIFKNDTIVAL